MSWGAPEIEHGREEFFALKTEVKLKNPSRNATVIKSLKGEVELFNPTESNGAILRVKDVLKHPAEPIQNPALARFGIQLVYLTKESYETKKRKLKRSQNPVRTGRGKNSATRSANCSRGCSEARC